MHVHVYIWMILVTAMSALVDATSCYPVLTKDNGPYFAGKKHCMCLAIRRLV